MKLKPKLYSIKKSFLTFVFFAIFVFPVSCMGRTDQQIRKSILSAIDSNDFSSFLNPKHKLLSELEGLNDGSLFYTGTHLQDRGYTQDAIKYFRYGAKKYEMPYQLLCEDALYKITDDKEKINILKKRLNKAKSSGDKEKITELEDVLNILFFQQGKYENLTKEIPIIFAETKLNEELITAFTGFSEKTTSVKTNLPEQFFDITNARILFYKKHYPKAWISAKKILESESLDNLSRQIISDFGRVAIYGATDFVNAANIFETLFLKAEKIGNIKSDLLFVLSFYTARLYTKSGNSFYNLAIHYFKKAEENATSNYDYDNALWYRLDTMRLDSFNDYFAELKRSTHLWRNSYWYEDLVDSLIVDFTKQEDEVSLQELKNALDATKLQEAKARLSYIIARTGNPENKTKNFELAFENNHNSLYYKVMASYFLNKPTSYKGYSIKTKRETNPDFSEDEATRILRGYVKYKLYRHIYSQMKILHPNISPDEAMKFSQSLNDAGYYASSMSCMQFAMRAEGAKINNRHLKLAYPRPWLSIVRKYTKKYNVPEYIMFALMRSESFFKPSVISHAGAIGLTQLMRPTAADVAGRLKIDKYDLNNPDTNIHFGTFYFSNMIERHDDKIMQAIFAYNAGPGSVRRWKRKFGNICDDLILEKMPFAETRGYGRRVMATAVIYANLYYGKSADYVVREIFPDFNK
ncbi:MAG: lytic transglycosylase [Treponema sp.]|nr:MAG: lytic transglycosylase [Treponema sp.]